MFELIQVEKEKQVDEKIKFLNIEELEDKDVQYDIYNSHFVFPSKHRSHQLYCSYGSIIKLNN